MKHAIQKLEIEIEGGLFGTVGEGIKSRQARIAMHEDILEKANKELAVLLATQNEMKEELTLLKEQYESQG